MNFEKAIDHVSSKLAMAITREDQHAILRPLLVEAFRDGKRRAKREALYAMVVNPPVTIRPLSLDRECDPALEAHERIVGDL